MTPGEHLPDDLIDAHVDVEISGCLNLRAPRSFFLYAGAGSGKTQSLIKALKFIKANHAQELALRGQRVGVITYTNAACDEITRRIAHNPLFDVSTIHSFAWSLIQGYDRDIRAWVEKDLREKIAKAEEELPTKGPGTKIARDIERRLRRARERLAELPAIRRFVYSPQGDLRGRDALNHSDVISITAEFLRDKPVLARVLIGRYPILFIDESQDTNKQIMAALLKVQERFSGSFCLGLFGDMMQRIYLDGLPDLARQIPNTWAAPAKVMNHRSSKRVVALVNRIRADVDDLVHKARGDAAAGHVRLFPLPANAADKPAVEARVAHHMAEITGDHAWRSSTDAYKGLILEHEMAASRMGFQEFFAPLKKIDSFSTGLLDGTLPAIRLFTDQVLPLIQAHRRQDPFTVKRILDKDSPLLAPDALRTSPLGPLRHLKQVGEVVQGLVSLWQGEDSPSLLAVLQYVHEHELFQVPRDLLPFVGPAASSQDQSDSTDAPDADTPAGALRLALSRPFREVEGYVRYLGERSPFGTHQGVKGLEYERVMVILDDEGAKGTLFNYDRLFGVAPPPKSSGKKDQPAKEAPDDRTRRLLYVTCSRARKSLAVVAYTADPTKLAQNVVDRGWFARDEVVRLGQ